MGSKNPDKNLILTKIKKEAPDLDYKESPEAPMKDMLGWCGGGSSSDTSSDMESHSLTRLNRDTSPQSKHHIPAGYMCCAWCQKVGYAKQFTLKTPNGSKVFCSEQCFTQCRRANFKRNKTCDWCRHVRHTVNYVDFTDGDHQLQFCSDKCLNQYKMNIFCKETQAHLELHPHLQEATTSNSSEKGGANLITPEMWMRDCRSLSPDTDKSGTPPRVPSPLIEIKMSPTRCKTPEKKSRKKTKKMVGKMEPSEAKYMPPFQHYTRDHRPMFFLPPPAHLLPADLRVRQPMRKAPPPGGVPPLLPLNRPPHLLPILPPAQSLLPPPTTIVPYPIFVPIPIPIPIPIPLPGLKLSDITNSNKTADPPATSEPAVADHQSEVENLSVPSLKTVKPAPPPRKRKRLSEIVQECETIRKPKTVHA